MTAIGEGEAFTRAFAALAEEAKEPDSYSWTMEESDKEWFIHFEGPPPQPPGTDLSVYVSKIDGEVRVIKGE